MNFKADKVAEEKDAKSKEFLLKKIKALEEDKAKAVIAKIELNEISTRTKLSKIQHLVLQI